LCARQPAPLDHSSINKSPKYETPDATKDGPHRHSSPPVSAVTGFVALYIVKMKYFFARFLTFFEPKSFSTGVIYIEGVIPSGRSGGLAFWKSQISNLKSPKTRIFKGFQSISKQTFYAEPPQLTIQHPAASNLHRAGSS
jgi:hypothetical protein